MKTRDDATWTQLIPTSMGVRITPENHAPVSTSDRYYLQATSAESNVGSVAAALGEPVLVLSAFVAGSPISAFIKANLRSRGMTCEGPEREQGGAWGYRHQFNIADTGYGLRAPRVWNDRAGEVGLTLNAADFDLERIFAREGVKLMHVSGLIASLSPETSQFCLDLVRVAKANGTLVSFDLNYRASFWSGRESQLRESFTEIASVSDVLIGNEEDFQLALGIEGPAAGGEQITDQMDAFVGMIDRAHEKFGQVSYFATTLRTVVSVNEHLWGAIAWHDGELSVVPQRPIGVLDRVGGGDGFVGGFLYGLLKGWDLTKSTQFGWATGALAATSLNDYASPADEEQVWSIWRGNARVVR